jgi:hypothetical protein
MRRREFITLVGGAMLPLAARAQQPGKLPTIGFLVSGTPASHGQWFAVLAQRLREFGWIEGRTIAIEYRFAQGREESFTEIRSLSGTGLTSLSHRAPPSSRRSRSLRTSRSCLPLQSIR